MKPSDFKCTFTETQGLVQGPNCVQTFLASLLQRESVAQAWEEDILKKFLKIKMIKKSYLISLDDTNKFHPNPLTLQAQNYVHLPKGVLLFRNHATTQIKMSKERDFFPLSNSPCSDTSSWGKRSALCPIQHDKILIHT